MANFTKLPPGEAEGARDLQNWGKRRLVGRAGPRAKKEKKKEKLDAADSWLAYYERKNKWKK